MARGKFNKRGGGKTFEAQSAEEIELRNKRLAEFEEERARRRAEEGADEDGEDGGDDDGEDTEEADNTTAPAAADGKKDKAKPDDKPAVVTTEADHRRNLKKLEEVRKRREEAEKRRKAEEEAEKTAESDRIQKMKELALEDDSDDEDDGKKKKKKSSKAKSIPKLSKIDIKKMKPNDMKEALKERGLEIQGNKNELQARLLKYEAER
jgi:hypothetical protein